VHIDGVDRVRLWLHESMKAHGSIALVDGEDIQGYALSEYVNGIAGAAVKMVVVSVMLYEYAVNVDTGIILDTGVNSLTVGVITVMISSPWI
jgi:hypothetical protein